MPRSVSKIKSSLALGRSVGGAEEPNAVRMLAVSVVAGDLRANASTKNAKRWSQSRVNQDVADTQGLDRKLFPKSKRLEHREGSPTDWQILGLLWHVTCSHHPPECADTLRMRGKLRT